MRRLTILSGLGKGAVYDLSGRQITVGRADENAIVFEDTDVSRFHAVFVREGDEYHIRDLGSINGLRVGGKAVTDAKLTPGVELEIGMVKAKYDAAPAGAVAAIAVGTVGPAAAPLPVTVVRKSEYEGQMEALNKLNRELNLQLLNSRHDLHRTQQQTDAPHSAEIERLKTELTAARQDIERTHDSATQIDSLAKRNDELTILVSSKDKEIEQVRRELTDHATIRDKAIEQVRQELTNQLTNKDKEIERVRQETAARLDRELKVVNDELARARDEVVQVRGTAEERIRVELTERQRIASALTLAEGERDRLSKEFVEMQTRLRQVAGDLEEVRSELALAQSGSGKSDELLRERIMLQAEAARLKEQSEAELQRITRERIAEAEQLRRELSDARREIENHAKKATAPIQVMLPSESVANDGELQRVRHELQQANAQLNVARQVAEKVEQLTRENQELAAKLMSTEREITGLQQAVPAKPAEAERTLQGDLAAARTELSRLKPTAPPPRKEPGPSLDRPLARPPTTSVRPPEAPRPVDPAGRLDVVPAAPPSRLQKILVAVAVAAIVLGLVWQIFKGEKDALPRRSDRPTAADRMIEDRVIVEEKSSLTPSATAPAAPAAAMPPEPGEPKPAVGGPAAGQATISALPTAPVESPSSPALTAPALTTQPGEAETIAPPGSNPSPESTATPAPESKLTNPTQPVADPLAIPRYVDPNGRFSFITPTGWKVEELHTPSESRLRLVSGKDEIFIAAHGTSWPELHMDDAARVNESMIAQFRLRHPEAYAETEGSNWFSTEDVLAMRMNLSMSEGGEKHAVRLVEYRKHGRACSMELLIRTPSQRDLLGMIFDSFLTSFELTHPPANTAKTTSE